MVILAAAERLIKRSEESQRGTPALIMQSPPTYTYIKYIVYIPYFATFNKILPLIPIGFCWRMQTSRFINLLFIPLNPKYSRHGFFEVCSRGKAPGVAEVPPFIGEGR